MPVSTSPSRPQLSVIVPVRNEAAHIRECAEAILREAPDGGIEVIVVDGMSDDDTPRIVTEMADADDRIRLLQNPKRFVPTAMNLGIAAARGDLIGRIDGHCAVMPGYFGGCIERLESGGYDCVGGVLVNEGDSAASRAIAAAMSSPVGVGGSRFRTGVANETLVDTVAFGVYRKEVFERIGDFDEQLIRNQDDELNLRLTRSGGKILLVPSIQVRYFVRGSLRKLARQYFQYGFWKIRVIRKHKHVASVRHIVPSLFLLSLATLALLSVWSRWALASVAAVVALYGAALILEGVRVTRGRGASPLRAALAMAVMHFSYGAGFLSGLVSAITRGRRSPERHSTLSR